MRAETKAQRYDSKRQDVLRGAGRVFARLGYHNASLNEIGAELGTTAAALYYYAKSKDELLDECRKLGLQAAEVALADAKSTGVNGFDGLRIFFEQYAALVCSDFGRCLVGIDISDIPVRMQKSRRAQQQNIRKEIQALIRVGIKDGSVRACNDLVVANMLFGAFNNLTKWWRPAGALSLGAVAASYLDVLANGISTGHVDRRAKPRSKSND